MNEVKKQWKIGILIGATLLFVTVLGGWFFTKENSVFKKDIPEKNQNSTVDQKDAKKNSDDLLEKSHFQGTALLVSGDQILYQKSYGYANVKEKLPNKVKGTFPIASLQKIITGSIILELVEEDKLTLNTTLDTFYPEVDFGKSITIQDLLDHKSGILMDEKEPSELLSDQKSQINYVLDTLSVVGNKEFNYTNSNYSLLAGIISKIMGSPYQEVVKERVIDKLSLHDTYFWDDIPKNEILPKPYYYMEKDYVEDPSPTTEKLLSSLLGAGNMYMSTEDFLVFIRSLANGQLFKQDEYERLTGAKQEGYRAGIIYFDDLKYSEGSLGGYDTVIYGDQDNKNLVILFANQPAKNGMRTLSEALYDQL